MARTAPQKVIRQWQILQKIGTARRGMTCQALAAELSVHRSTVHRDLEVLQAAGFPLVPKTINGEARWSTIGKAAILQLQPGQAAALMLAEQMMTPLTGTGLHKALQSLLAQLREKAQRAQAQQRSIATSIAGAENEAVVAQLDRAIDEQRQVRTIYQSTSAQAPRTRVLEAVEWIFSDGHLYCAARDPEASRAQLFKTFKAARFSKVEVLSKTHDALEHYDAEAFHAHSIGVWSGEVMAVRILIAKEVARFVTEWPLAADQALEEVEAGVVVSAQVAGSMEVLRWVLRWGRNACVLSPAGLREKVEDELRAALRGYEDEGG